MQELIECHSPVAFCFHLPTMTILILPHKNFGFYPSVTLLLMLLELVMLMLDSQSS